MIHPEYLGERGNPHQRPLNDWLQEVVSFFKIVKQRGKNTLGQPLQLPSGYVGFPISGWLTKNLEVWPLYPRDIRQSILNPRNVGSRALA